VSFSFAAFNSLRQPLLSLAMMGLTSNALALTGAERLLLEQEKRAAELYAKAQRFALRGAPGNAVETLESLVRNYPRSRWSGAAQWEIARLYADNHQDADAFDAAQLLVDHFPDYFEAALDLQFRLAKKVLVRYEDIERHPDALKPKQLVKKTTVSDMLRIIIRNGPHWERVAEAHYLLGVALEKEGKPEEARKQHESFAENHKGHELVDDAAYQIAYIDYKAWKRMRSDAPQAREKAETSLIYFLVRFPESSKAAQANGSLIEIRNAELRELQRLAEFYDKQGKDKAAAIYYLTLVRRFPETMALPGLEERLNAWLEKYPEMAVLPKSPQQLPPAPPEYLAAPPPPDYDPVKNPVMARPQTAMPASSSLDDM
jgi:outer membrane protein assembly factor BamD (BamD/ComL family)